MSSQRWPSVVAGAAILILLTGSAGASRGRFPSQIGMTTSGSRQIWFPEDFSFPMGGVTYKSIYLTANGLLTFHTVTTSAPTGTTVSTFLAGRPMIAPLWVDLDPSLGGQVTAGRISPTEFEFRWESVPAGGMSGNISSFRCVLVSDGSFRFHYGTLNPIPSGATASAIVGFSTGNANTNGSGQAVNFTTSQCPAAWGTGTEPAIYQLFSPAAGAAALSGMTICFTPTMLGSGRLSMSDDDTVEIALTGWTFPFHGNNYTSFWLNSNGSLTFGGRDTSYTPSNVAFTNRYGRLAAYWTDLNPGSTGIGLSGTITFQQSLVTAIVSWTNVPTYGQANTSNTFSIAINSDGSFVYTYGNMANVAPGTSPTVLVGQTAGYPLTSATETPSPITPPGPISSNLPARFDLPMVPASPYRNLTIQWDNTSIINSSALPLGNTEVVEVKFPAGFTFPFAGNLWTSAFVSSDGYVTFGGSDLDATETTPELLSLFPRVCGAWDDLNAAPTSTTGPSPEGAISVSATAGGVSVTWQGVFESSTTGSNTFSIQLLPTGAFSIIYQAMSLQDCIAGYSAGGGKTLGNEAPVNLSASSVWGRGTEPAIFEAFTTGFDLANRTLAFPAVGPILFQNQVTSPGPVQVALGAGPADGGLVFVMAGSFATQPGISYGPCGATIPLNLDPLFLVTLSGFFLYPPTGTLDGHGQFDSWPGISSALVIQVPPNLGGRGISVWFGFVTVGPPGTPCRLRTISPPAPFTIP